MPFYLVLHRTNFGHTDSTRGIRVCLATRHFRGYGTLKAYTPCPTFRYNLVNIYLRFFVSQTVWSQVSHIGRFHLSSDHIVIGMAYCFSRVILPYTYEFSMNGQIFTIYGLSSPCCILRFVVAGVLSRTRLIHAFMDTINYKIAHLF